MHNSSDNTDLITVLLVIEMRDNFETKLW